ncbi:MAG: hypothetical protein ACOY3Z_12580 [Thermodesulfobacteriota bacterium]
MKITLPRAGIAASQPVSPGREAATLPPAPTASLSLAAGQLVKGEVVGLGQDGAVLLRIDGQIIEARSEILLRPGSELWLEVRRDEPLWLGLADRKGAAQELLRQLFADPAGMGRGLRLLFEKGMGASQAAGLPAALAELAGLLAETEVGAEASPEKLLRLLTLLRRGGEGIPEAARQGEVVELLRLLASQDGMPKGDQAALHRLAVQLDLQAQLASLPAPADQAVMLLAPCLFGMQAGWGQWLLAMDRQAGGNATEPGCVLSFFLAMSRLGEVQLQARIKGKALAVEVVVEDLEALRYLEGMGGGLVEPLSRLGYQPVSFGCRQARSGGMLVGLKAELERAVGLAGGTRLVDLRA